MSPTLIALAGLSGLGCGDATVIDDETAAAGVGGGAVTGSTASTGGNGGGGGGTVQPDGCYDQLAADVALVDASLFQVVDVPLLRNGEAIPVSLRSGPVVQGRAAVVRAGLRVGPGFEARELGLRVTITNPSGVRTFLGRGSVGADSTNDPSTGLRVELPSEVVAADATYHLSVVECEPPTSEPSRAARFPNDGEADLGAVDHGPIKIHILPYEINGFVPDTSESVLEGMRARVYSVFPTNEVQITVGPVVAGFATEVDATDLLVATGVAQESPGAMPSDVYYYGIYTGYANRDEFNDQCNCVTGSSQALFDRAGFAVGAGFADARAEDTLIHELGHLHGLPHAPCGGPSDVDPHYPHVDGEIGGWGWDVRSSTFVPADHKDMMAYCYPRWVSAYHYGKLASWMATAQAQWPSTANVATSTATPAAHHHCFGH